MKIEKLPNGGLRLEESMRKTEQGFLRMRPAVPEHEKQALTYTNHRLQSFEQPYKTGRKYLGETILSNVTVNPGDCSVAMVASVRGRQNVNLKHGTNS